MIFASHNLGGPGGGSRRVRNTDAGCLSVDCPADEWARPMPQLPRSVLRHRAYSFWAVATLAFTCGATLSILTVVDALWYSTVPAANVSQLVMLVSDARDTDSHESATFGDLDSDDSAWTAFAGAAGQVVTSGPFAGFKPSIQFRVDPGEREVLAVTSQYFRLFGLSIRGRDFRPEDNRQGAEPVAIISDSLWRTAFRADPALVGSVVSAEPLAVRVIGVAPAGFRGIRRGERADVWVPGAMVTRLAPIAAIDLDAETIRHLTFARLRAGDSPDGAKRRFIQTAPTAEARMSREHIELVPVTKVFGTPDSISTVIDGGKTVRVAAVAAGLVNVGGCTTLIMLILAHYERRRHEFSIRAALGATRVAIARQLGGELMWLAAGGLAAGLLFSYWFLRSLPSVMLLGGVDLGRLVLASDWRVLCAGAAIVVATVLSAALIPFGRFAGRSLARPLVRTHAVSTRHSQRFRQLLLSIQVAITVVVLLCCGLCVRAVLYGFGKGSGLDIDHTAFLQVQVVSPFLDPRVDFGARRAYVQNETSELAVALRRLPGVIEVALGSAPLGPDQSKDLLTQQIVETSFGRRHLRLGVITGSAHLLQTYGVAMSRGRALVAADATASPRPAVVSKRLAATLWPSIDPMGQRLFIGLRRLECVVVGISQDFAYGSLTAVTAGTIVLVNADNHGIAPSFVLRSDAPARLAEPIVRLTKERLPHAPRPRLLSGRDLVARDLGKERLGAWFFAGFGVVALMLGIGGVFGLVAYFVDSRTREFGVRFALGSTLRQATLIALRSAFWPVTLGTVLGALGAIVVCTRYLVPPNGLSVFDARTWCSVVTLVLMSAVIASYVAAKRIRKIQPQDALRAD